MYDYAQVKNDDFILVGFQFDSFHSESDCLGDVINTFFECLGRIDFYNDGFDLEMFNVRSLRI